MARNESSRNRRNFPANESKRCGDPSLETLFTPRNIIYNNNLVDTFLLVSLVITYDYTFHCQGIDVLT